MSKLGFIVSLVTFFGVIYFIYDYSEETSCPDTAIYVKCKNYFD